MSSLEDAAVEYVRDELSLDEVYDQEEIITYIQENCNIADVFDISDVIDSYDAEDILKQMNSEDISRYTSKQDWEEVGEIGVDAGCIWLGDPCYILSKEANTQWEKWEDFCKELEDKKFFDKKFAEFNYKLGYGGLGIVVSSGYGDGSYPVYVQYEDGRVKAVMVEFF